MNFTRSEKIKVIARVRPLLEEERDDHESVRASSNGSCMRVLSASPSMHASAKGETRSHQREFIFDRCFGSDSTTQGSLFNDCGIVELLDAGFEGYCSTIFAYGQTGSGKTYTMTGPVEDSKENSFEKRGLVPRSFRYIFDRISSNKKEAKFSIRASYYEIYNENVYDLLNLTLEPLPIRFDSCKGFYVEGLMVVSCDSIDDMMLVMNEGITNRRSGSHELNKDSSRSHSILTLYIDSEEESTVDSKDATFGKLNFIDLAGSEKVKTTKVTGVELKEATSINRSLFTLGKIISLLSNRHDAELKKKSSIKSHIPYRDSTLTKLLMDSLGGTAKTLMIACVSPGSRFLNETLSTFRYATRARNITNKPKIMLQPKSKDQIIHSLREEVQYLRTENALLREKLENSSSLPPINEKYRNDRFSAPAISQGFSLHTGKGRRNGRNRSSLSMQEYDRKLDILQNERDEAKRRCNAASESYEELSVENSKLRERIRHVEAVFLNEI
eukprot:g2382.t1